ncbi:hypothetical protein [Egbenema bharatensis]|uniref:hypothetical protein n=1 Tax=Egbenema bharatensis TaxID=3463334 RepID=UPI003A8944EE
MRSVIGIGLLTGLCSISCTSLPLQPSNHLISSIEPSTPDPESIALPACPHADWELIQGFETPQYFLALCQQGESLYLVGHEKQRSALIVVAPAHWENDRILAEDGNKYSYEIRHGTLTVKHNGKIIVQEGIS